MQNLWSPLEPISSANPPTGTRHVPVTNCKSRARFSLSVSRTNYVKWNEKNIMMKTAIICFKRVRSLPARTTALAYYCDYNDDKLSFSANRQRQFPACHTTLIPTRAHRNTLTIQAVRLH